MNPRAPDCGVRRQTLLAAVRASGRAGLQLRTFAESQGWSFNATWHALSALRSQGLVRLQGAARSPKSRWVDATLHQPMRRPVRWPWDDRGRSAIGADLARVQREAYDARVMFEAAMGRPAPGATASATAAPASLVAPSPELRRAGLPI